MLFNSLHFLVFLLFVVPVYFFLPRTGDAEHRSSVGELLLLHGLFGALGGNYGQGDGTEFRQRQNDLLLDKPP